MHDGTLDQSLVDLFKHIYPAEANSPLGFTRQAESDVTDWDSRDGRVELRGRYHLVDTLEPEHISSLLVQMSNVKVNKKEHPNTTVSATYVRSVGFLHVLTYGERSESHTLEILTDDGSTFRASNNAIISGHENPTDLPQFVVDMVLAWARSEYDTVALEID